MFFIFFFFWQKKTFLPEAINLIVKGGSDGVVQGTPVSVNLQGICVSKSISHSFPAKSNIESFPAKPNLMHTYPSLSKPEPYSALEQPDLLKATAAKRKGTLSLEKENIVFDAVQVGKSQVLKVI